MTLPYGSGHYPPFNSGKLLINGAWVAGERGSIPVTNPATGSTIATCAHASAEQIRNAAAAAAAAQPGFARMAAIERAAVLRKTAAHLALYAGDFAHCITIEQGKPLAEAAAEVQASVELLEWFAEEGRRNYGRLIPPRHQGIEQVVTREPVGPVAAFTPWNFPLSQLVRKLGPALAAGCTVVLKPAEETPGPALMLAELLEQAGLPKGALGMIFGDPQEISGTLVAAPEIRKISFTGSVPVGKHLAALAGAHMKRATMELGGHAPAIITADADLDKACAVLARAKFRNAGQVCVSPTRFLVERTVYGEVCERLAALARDIRMGDGLDEGTQMGPLAHERRRSAVEELIADALACGGSLLAGGSRTGNRGYFFEPTVIADVTLAMRAMNEEPFGPVALVREVADLDEAIGEANRLPFALAAYAFTGSARSADRIRQEVEAGMTTINHLGLALAETPFGGIKESGYGSEGGTEALLDYTVPKFTTMAREEFQ